MFPHRTKEDPSFRSKLLEGKNSLFRVLPQDSTAREEPTLGGEGKPLTSKGAQGGAFRSGLFIGGEFTSEKEFLYIKEMGNFRGKLH